MERREGHAEERNRHSLDTLPERGMIPNAVDRAGDDYFLITF